jgi:hypothetical protein
MTEDWKRQLNSAVVNFVHQCQPGARGYDAAQILEDLERINRQLIDQSGVEHSQLVRMVDYVVLVGWPEDPFAVAEYDLAALNREPRGHWPADALRALALRKEETETYWNDDLRFASLIAHAFQRDPLRSTAKRRIIAEILKESYDHPVPAGDTYKETIDQMVARVRRYRPECSLVEALEAAILWNYLAPGSPADL